jgi:hypothetical protein
LICIQDKALRYEQTFNILNFEEKLKGLEQHPDFPKQKPWKYKADKDTKAEYNIISNIPFNQHFYDKPEKRPTFVEKVTQCLCKSLILCFFN